LAGLLNLGIVLPVGLQGRWDIVVALVTIEGTVLTEAKTALVVGPTQLIAPQPPKQDQSSTNVASLGQAPTAALPPSPERERALGLHAKGKELLDQGNVQPARMLFRRAAEAGLAESALALGGTFDPVELAKLRVLGLQPDVASARQWYEKARQLGAREAEDRLRRLENR
jgi:TPR repeat protein